jgi:hypothetical protein
MIELATIDTSYSCTTAECDATAFDGMFARLPCALICKQRAAPPRPNFSQEILSILRQQDLKWVVVQFGRENWGRVFIASPTHM